MYRAPLPEPPLVITAFHGGVIALDASTGEPRWRQTMEGELIRLHVTSERVIAVGGELVALDYASGRVLARLDTAGSTLLVVGERAYLSWQGVMTCVALDTYRVLWKNELPGTGYGAAALAVPGMVVQGDGG